MSRAVFAIAGSEQQTVDILNDLRESGFSNDDISILFPDRTGSRHLAHERHTKAPEGALAGASAGGVLAGAVGLLAGLGLVRTPGAEPLRAAGPILAALSGAAVGAAVGGVTGALAGLGMPEFEARRYEGRVRAGNILLSVHTDDDEEAATARSILKDHDASDIATAGETSDRSGDPGDFQRFTSRTTERGSSR